MKNDKDRYDGQAASPAKASRQDRLKLALRENLKRRKSQARGRSDPVSDLISDPLAAPSEGANASLDDSNEKKPRR
jgi:hypothetical protein